MSANDSFHIAVLPGDGIGPEVMAPALEVLNKATAAAAGLRLRFTEAPAGAGHYRETGTSLPESTVKLCEQADAILLGAWGLPHIRYPDNTEIMPQVELRFIFDLYAGVRPCRLIPNIPSPIVGAAERGIAVDYWRYAGSDRRMAWVERWPNEVRAGVGRETYPDSIAVWPQTAPAAGTAAAPAD